MDFIEVFGAVSGLIYLFAEIKQKIWLWPVGVITSAFYIYIFFASKFYADMGLQFYYLGVSIYGWYHWINGAKQNVQVEKDNSEKIELPVSHISIRQLIGLLILTVIFFVLFWQILSRFTDSPVPFGDAFTTALSITATWMLARKIIEHWYIWMVVNTVSLALYIYKGLYPTSVLFLFNAAMSVVGFLQWRKSMVLNANTCVSNR